MTSCTMDSPVVQLTLQHVQAVDSHGRFFGVASSLGRISSISAGLAGRLAVLVLRWHAKHVDDQVVWFLGGAKSIDERDRDQELDPDFSMINRLRALEERIARMQTSVLSGVERCPVYAHNAVRRLAASYGDLQEAVAEMRGAMQAYEADRCALATTAARAESAEALNALLAQLHAEA